MTRMCSQGRTRGHTVTPCRIKATWRVGLLLRAHNYDAGEDYFFEKIAVCNSCRARLKIDDVINNRIFGFIRQLALNAGRQPPNKRLARLRFERLDKNSVAGGVEWAGR